MTAQISFPKDSLAEMTNGPWKFEVAWIDGIWDVNIRATFKGKEPIEIGLSPKEARWLRDELSKIIDRLPERMIK